ncbi:MAG: EAL domain-containing protein, partial [Lachnospiraceae bacterium]|nr:EAL domain-containing protein [Lachnospiraceae bacterium]
MNNMALTFIGVSMPVFLVLIIATVSRRLTKGRSNILFLLILILSLIVAIADFIANLFNEGINLLFTNLSIITVFNYVYFFCRHAVNMLYIFYIYSVTRTWFKIKGVLRKILVALPYICVCVLLIMNPKNHLVFTVTPDTGYERGDGILLIYGLAAVYLVFGMYLILSRKKLLRLSEWLSLSAIYFLNIIGVGIQFVREDLIVESFFTAITLLFVVLYVQKPEIQIDLNTGLPGYFAFRDEMKKIETSGQRVQVIIASITNSDELRRYLGEKGFFDYIYAFGRTISLFGKREKLHFEYYYEDPGNIYVILEEMDYNPVQAIPQIRDSFRKNNPIADVGVRVDLKAVSIMFPQDIPTAAEIITFGHNFTRFAGSKIFYHAPQIFDRREYQIRMRLDEILKRGISQGRIRLGFDPIWSVKEDRAEFAEVSAAIDDQEFGLIDEDTLEVAAGAGGSLTIFEEKVLEQVFSYVGTGSMVHDGFSYVVLKLSAGLAMQKSFTDLIWNLRGKYGVHPEHICFAFRESVYNTMGENYEENINKLSIQGYRLALDGYGRGYTDITHLSLLPVSTIILDGVLVNEAESEKAATLLRG